MYRLLAAPVLGLALVLNVIRGKDTGISVRARLAFGGKAPNARHIWVHGASVGELRAARFLLESLLNSSPYHIVITCNSLNAAVMVSAWNLQRAHVYLAPVDAFGAPRRFLRKWQVAAQITLENELWPSRVARCSRLGIPIFGVGTRPPKAALGAGPFAGILRRALTSYSRIWPMGADASTQLARILPADMLAPAYNAKATVTHASRADQYDPMLRGWAGKDVVLAASTHEGEEALVGRAFAKAVQENGALRLIIAPRHPERGAKIVEELRALGLQIAQRAMGEAITAATQIYVADTLHEMAIWYHAAPRTIIGGTFTDRGGHTPVEPILARSQVFFGPDVRNHADLFATLQAEHGATPLADFEALTRVLAQPCDMAEHDRSCTVAARVVEQLSATSRAVTEQIVQEVLNKLSRPKR